MFNATPLLRLAAACRYRKLAAQRPAEVQRNELLQLIRKAELTQFGRDHHFSSIRSVEDYPRAVPLRTYEAFWNEYWQKTYPTLINSTWPGKIPFVAVSSGTSSGTTKYIPCSSEMVASNTKAGVDLLIYHVKNRPTSQILGGRSFMLGGSTDLENPVEGVFVGDLSGIAVKTLPWWARQRYFPPPELALLKDWEQKIDKLARGSQEHDIRMISGVPSWLLIFFDKLSALVPSSEVKVAKLFPNLEMLVHGGVNFAPYYRQFSERLAGSKAELREVYPASEGFIAVADRGFGEGLRLNLDHGLFFEFVPFEELQSPSPTRHWIGNAELGVNYAIVVTSCAGLWSYILGDTVKFVDLSPPRLLITGRTSYYLSAFGEHVIAEEVEDAVTTAAREIKLDVADFTVGPVFPKNPGDLGGHVYFIEFTNALPAERQIEQLSIAIDRRLHERNEDYAAHRAGGFGLSSPTIRALRPGTFAAWMKKRGKLGGQNKVPRIITRTELLDDLKDFTR